MTTSFHIITNPLASLVVRHRRFIMHPDAKPSLMQIGPLVCIAKVEHSLVCPIIQTCNDLPCSRHAFTVCIQV